MPIYKIKYTSNNIYNPAIYTAMLEFLIEPCESETQKIVDFSIQTFPQADVFESENLYWFKTLKCHLPTGVTSFKLESEFTIEKDNVNPFGFNVASVKDQHDLLFSHDVQVENYYFAHQSKFTQGIQKEHVPKLTGSDSIFEFSCVVNEFVYNALTYDLSCASVDNLLQDVLKIKKGVCQDYAHYMLAILRENSIPARYVSGYLNQGIETEGSGAIHAWVEVFIPHVGWLGFDPTNNLLEDHNYIKIAHGVDIFECQSLQGIVRSQTGNSKTEYDVLVQEQQIIQNQ